GTPSVMAANTIQTANLCIGARSSRGPERPYLDLARPAPRLRKIVGALQPKPGFGARAESFGQPDRHFDRDSRFSIQQVGQRLPRHPETLSSFGDRKTKRLQALTAYNAAGMRWDHHTS